MALNVQESRTPNSKTSIFYVKFNSLNLHVVPLPVDVAISADFPASQDALRAAARAVFDLGTVLHAVL